MEIVGRALRVAGCRGDRAVVGLQNFELVIKVSDVLRAGIGGQFFDGVALGPEAGAEVPRKTVLGAGPMNSFMGKRGKKVQRFDERR